MPNKYVLGIDLGTQSGRATLVRVQDGKVCGVSVKTYDHGVMVDCLPSGVKLPSNFALQHPQDYLDVLKHTISDVRSVSGKDVENIIGIGIATTSSTVLPVLQDGTPLCFLPKFADDPHSWPKLWKHHGAQREALELDDFLKKKAPELSTQFCANSAERMLPKILEVKRCSPKVYDTAFTFVELTDWLYWYLTGKLQRSVATAGYKAMWRHCTGYLKPELLDDSWEYTDIIKRKLSFGPVIPLGHGEKLDVAKARQLNLSPNTVVATGQIDAHAAVIGCGVDKPGTLVMVMGTSSCHMLLADSLKMVEGMSGAVQGGIVGEYYAYESGQSSVGDQFHWYVKNAIPGSYEREAQARGVDIYEYLETLASRLPLGRTGLLALDWWNGNRSVLNNANLSGLIIGLTSSTKPEEIYLTLLESTAFGAKRIVESYEDKGLPVIRVYATGGLAQKNELLVRIYCNVIDKEIEVIESDYTTAQGMAMWASVAVGAERGGYATIGEAVDQMSPQNRTIYEPEPRLAALYAALYEDYKVLYDYFGRGKNDVMERLKSRKDIIEQGL